MNKNEYKWIQMNKNEYKWIGMNRITFKIPLFIKIASLGSSGLKILKRLMLNVCEATMHKQIMENADINNLIKILSLQHNKKYVAEVPTPQNFFSPALHNLHFTY